MSNPETIYDAFPHGIGEDPGPHVPVEVTYDAMGLGVKHADPKDSRTVKEIAADAPDKVSLVDVLTQGEAAEAIDAAHQRGHHVGFSWGVHEVRLFIARHRQAITATGVAVTVFSAATVGALHLLDHRKEERGEK